MGDRTYLNVTLSKKDYEKKESFFEDYGFEEEEDNGNGTFTLVDFEANYGGVNFLESLAQEGIPFDAYHGNGGGYSAYSFCYDGGEFPRIKYEEGASVKAKEGEEGAQISLNCHEIAEHECELVVRCGWDGIVKSEALEGLRKYVEYRKKALKAIEERSAD